MRTALKTTPPTQIRLGPWSRSVFCSNKPLSLQELYIPQIFPPLSPSFPLDLCCFLEVPIHFIYPATLRHGLAPYVPHNLHYQAPLDYYLLQAGCYATLHNTTQIGFRFPFALVYIKLDTQQLTSDRKLEPSHAMPCF